MLPLLFYSRSLLYLVSEAFEDARSVPLLGMEKYYNAMPRLPNMHAWSSIGPETESNKVHGDFDDDEVTRQSVMRRILESR